MARRRKPKQEPLYIAPDGTPRYKARKKRRKLPVVLGFFVIMIAICAMAAFAVVTTCLKDLPDYDQIDLYANDGYSVIYASDRKTEIGRVTLKNRTEVGINEVSQFVLDGTVATEDERFYEHQGVDPIGIARALWVNLTGQGSEGASTITQQLVRNTVLLDEMNEITIKRKIREMYIALEIEKTHTKDEILMIYLNVINYGDGCYGIEAAAEDYFGCSAKDLTLSQAAMLVGIPQSPNALCPRTDYDAALQRSYTVLKRMLSNGYIEQWQFDEACATPPTIVEKSLTDDSTSSLAPYFVDYVKGLLQSDEMNLSELSQGGLKIFTTLDVDCQTAANEAVQEGLEGYTGLDSSLTSIDPDNGNIVAMVGGKNYAENQFNLSTQMSRQAGSSFKVFALIAAIENGVSPNTSIDSSSPADIDGWEVSNSEGEGGGNMTLKTATTYSVNTVYARLTHVIGASEVVRVAKECGITSELSAYDSICLGTSGVNTLEMADAYATLANGGIHYDPVAILEIQNADEDVVYEAEEQKGVRVMSVAVAEEVTKILETVVTYGTGTKARLTNGQECAGKTGTSELARDLWFCGYTPQYATAVWSGYRQEQYTNWVGGQVSAPIWKLYMTSVLKNAKIEEFPTSDEELEYENDYDFPQASYSYGSSSSSSSSSSKTTQSNATQTDTSETSGTGTDTGGGGTGGDTGGGGTGGGDTGGGGTDTGGDTP